MRRLPHRLTAILLACLIMAGCADTVKKLGDLSQLQADISKKYSEAEVGVNLVNETLTISFVNSPLNAKSQAERIERAQETATFVVQHYPQIKDLDEIWVGFIKQETHFIVFHYAKGLGFYPFDRNATLLRPPPEVEPQPSEQYTTATHNSGLKQTDIVVRRLQLEGDLDNGLAVTPHYTVDGNITAAEPSDVPPKFVSFDFSSSSDKSMFPGEPKIIFIVDRKVVFQTEAQFSTDKFDEKFSENLALQVPYPAFLRLTSGKTLTMRIGDREYEFSSAHHDALLEMRAYVKEKELARPAGR